MFETKPALARFQNLSSARIKNLIWLISVTYLKCFVLRSVTVTQISSLTNSNFLPVPVRKRLVQAPRNMLHELRTTIEYGSTIWEYLRTATYDKNIASILSDVLSVAESNIIAISKSLIIRQRLTNNVRVHPLSSLVEFYSAPVPHCKVASPSLRQQIQAIKVRESTPRPFFWNNYFAPLLKFITMSDEDFSNNSATMNADEISTTSQETVVSTSKTSRDRRLQFTVTDSSIAKISKLVEDQLAKDRENQETGPSTNRGFISPNDTIHAPSTQESRSVYKYRITLFRRRNASAHTTSMLDLFKSFAAELLYRDKQAALLPIATEHASFTAVTSARQVQSIDASRMKIYFSPYARNQTRSLSGGF